MRLLLLALVLGASSACASEISREDQFKAAYLFNFLKFVEWPANVADDLLTVCFIGADGVHDTLAANIENKRAGTRRLAVRRLHSDNTLDGCNVLYIDANTGSNDPRAQIAREQPILTVSDAAGFARRGGMIELWLFRFWCG
jgi:hypothetical protein